MCLGDSTSEKYAHLPNQAKFFSEHWTWNCEKETTAKKHQETVTTELSQVASVFAEYTFSCRTSRRLKSFLQSTIALFNSFPLSVVTCLSKSGFTHALDRHFSADNFTSSCLVCPDRLFFLSFFLFSSCFLFLFFFSFLSFCTLFISSLYLFSLPSYVFTLVSLVLRGNPCKTYK